MKIITAVLCERDRQPRNSAFSAESARDKNGHKSTTSRRERERGRGGGGSFENNRSLDLGLSLKMFSSRIKSPRRRRKYFLISLIHQRLAFQRGNLCHELSSWFVQTKRRRCTPQDVLEISRCWSLSSMCFIDRLLQGFFKVFIPTAGTRVIFYRDLCLPTFMWKIFYCENILYTIQIIFYFISRQKNILNLKYFLKWKFHVIYLLVTTRDPLIFMTNPVESKNSQ